MLPPLLPRLEYHAPGNTNCMNGALCVRALVRCDVMVGKRPLHLTSSGSTRASGSYHYHSGSQPQPQLDLSLFLRPTRFFTTFLRCWEARVHRT